MEKIDAEKIIFKFIQKMKYLENEHILGCFFCGSFLTGFNSNGSDIDLQVVRDNSDPNYLVRGNMFIDGVRVEYFEKPISDLYMSVDNEFNSQGNAVLSIFGHSKIIFDKTGELQELQQYTRTVFSKPLKPLDPEAARERASILTNRVDELKKAYLNDSPYFYHLYHFTIEQIRDFYHKLNAIPTVQISKAFKVYTDENYRKALCIKDIPDNEFLEMYFDAICDNSLDKESKFEKVLKLFNYTKKDISLGDEYRILIISRNKSSKK